MRPRHWNGLPPLTDRSRVDRRRSVFLPVRVVRDPFRVGEGGEGPPGGVQPSLQGARGCRMQLFQPGSFPMRTAALASVIGTLITLLGIELATGQTSGTETIMRQKLTYAQAILEGVTREDYKKITDSTVPLLALTHRAEWNAIDRYDYLAFSMGFRQAVNDLADAAQRQNADGVAYSYMRMTMACVSCHRSLRDVKRP